MSFFLQKKHCSKITFVLKLIDFLWNVFHKDIFRHMILEDQLNVYRRFASILLDSVSILGTLFTFITYIRFRKQFTTKAYQISVIITMTICFLNSAIFLYANVSFTFTSHFKLCTIAGAITMFLEIYTFLWPGYMSILSFLLVIEYRPKCKRFSSREGLYTLWLICYNVITVCILVPIVVLFYMKGYFVVVGDWCWATDAGSSDPLSIFVGIVTIPLFGIITVFMIAIFGSISYIMYHRKVKRSLRKIDYIVVKASINSLLVKDELKRNEKAIIKSTWKTGAMCLILVGIDMVSIVVTLIFGKDYIWPNIYNELVACLWGSMQFLLGFCYVKNIWLLWFR